MGYTSQQYLEYLYQFYSDQAIADKVKYSRETITRIRLGAPGYTGTRINKKLEKIVRNLQAQEPQEVKQEPRPPAQVVTPVAAPPQVVTPAQYPQMKQAAAQVQDDISTWFEKSHCAKCPFRGLIPHGATKSQYQAWAKINYCSNKKSGSCPR